MSNKMTKEIDRLYRGAVNRNRTEPKDNGVVQEYVTDILKYYNENHDDLDDMKNFIQALQIVQSEVTQQAFNWQEQTS